MIDSANIIKFTDQLTDYIPVVSTIKNGGILLYQKICQIDELANPAKVTWKDKLKVHVISKERWLCVLAMVPLVGNVACLTIDFLKLAIDCVCGGRAFLGNSPTSPFHWLQKPRLSNYLLKAAVNNDINQASLYLSTRYSESHLSQSLEVIAKQGNVTIFKMILQAGLSDFSDQTLKRALYKTRNPEIALALVEVLMNKPLTENPSEIITFQLILSRYASRRSLELLNTLLTTCPHLQLGTSLDSAIRCNQKENVKLLLSHFSPLEEKDLKDLLLSAIKSGEKEIVDLFIPYIHSSEILYAALKAERYTLEIAQSLLSCPCTLTEEQVRDVLIGLPFDSKEIIRVILEKHPPISSNTALLVLMNTKHPMKLIYFIKQFKQLTDDHFLTLLNFLRSPSVRISQSILTAIENTRKEVKVKMMESLAK